MGMSKVDLSNEALDHLGKDNIASLSENSTAARKVSNAFDRTLRAALSRSHWTFARKIASLAGVTNDWDERWAYKYDEPNDLLTAVRLIPRVDVPNDGDVVAFQRLGGKIYTDRDSAKLEYVFDMTDTLSMPQSFLDAVSFLLARNVCMPLTRKMGLWNDLNQAFELQLALAVEHDAGQEPTYWATPSSYIEARGGGSVDVEGAAPDGSIYWS